VAVDIFSESSTQSPHIVKSLNKKNRRQTKKVQNEVRLGDATPTYGETMVASRVLWHFFQFAVIKTQLRSTVWDTMPIAHQI